MNRSVKKIRYARPTPKQAEMAIPKSTKCNEKSRQITAKSVLKTATQDGV